MASFVSNVKVIIKNGYVVRISKSNCFEVHIEDSDGNLSASGESSSLEEALDEAMANFDDLAEAQVELVNFNDPSEDDDDEGGCSNDDDM